jgi:hypothetical protein
MVMCGDLEGGGGVSYLAIAGIHISVGFYYGCERHISVNRWSLFYWLFYCTTESRKNRKQNSVYVSVGTAQSCGYCF